MSEQELNKLFARNLVKLLERRGISQADLAKALEVSESAVSLWCSGKTTPRMSKVDNICKLLLCTRDDLMGEDVLVADGDRLLALVSKATPEEIRQTEQYLRLLIYARNMKEGDL